MYFYLFLPVPINASWIACFIWELIPNKGFPGGSEVKVSASNVGDPGLIPGSGRSPGEGNGNPLQYPCLENPMDGGAWWATVHGVAKSRTRLSYFTFTCSNTYNVISKIQRNLPEGKRTWKMTELKWGRRCSLKAESLFSQSWEFFLCCWICTLAGPLLHSFLRDLESLS